MSDFARLRVLHAASILVCFSMLVLTVAVDGRFLSLSLLAMFFGLWAEDKMGRLL